MSINKPIATIVILIATALCVFLFVLPKYRESVRLQVESGELQAEYNGKELYYASLQKLLDKLAAHQDALAKIDSALPTERTLNPLVYFFHTQAKANGLTIKSSTFSTSSLAAAASKPALGQSKELQDVSFFLDLFGSYQGLKNFLKALENSSRLFQVESIAFASPQAEQGTVGRSQLSTYNFRLSVKTYTY